MSSTVWVLNLPEYLNPISGFLSPEILIFFSHKRMFEIQICRYSCNNFSLVSSSFTAINVPQPDVITTATVQTKSEGTLPAVRTLYDTIIFLFCKRSQD
jgi:hypothetical protein